MRGEISSQNATVDRLKAELANPEAEKKRNQELSETGAISASAYDTKRLAVDTAPHKVTEAEAIDRKNRPNTPTVNSRKSSQSQTKSRNT
ncbi:hypothetical protein [Microcoleus sp. herbarium12]|uniref:hypothetical protein n=1 Tax=Microcoleus sp. herbarium12 TaxID=3055437 RepID=UPI002FCEF330